MSRILVSSRLDQRTEREIEAHFGSEAFCEIERLLKRPSPDIGLRAEITKAVWAFLRGRAAGGVARIAQTRNHLKRIRKAAHEMRSAAARLNEALAPLLAIEDINSVHADAVAFLLHYRSGNKVDSIWLGDTAITTQEIEKAATAALEHLKGRGGPSPDADSHVLMSRLEAIYRHATGRAPTISTNQGTNAYGGNFFRLAEIVEGVAKPAAGERPRTNVGLGSAIKEKLSVRRKAGKEENPQQK